MELFWSQSEDPTSLISSKSLGRVYTYIHSKLLCQILELKHSQISMCQNLDTKEQTVHCWTVVVTCKSISKGAQYVTLDNKIKCLSLAVFFGNPTNSCNWNYIYVGTTNSKPPGPIIMVHQSEILSRSQVQFITLFFRSAQLCCAFYQPRQATRIWCRKTNFLS
jgi:hypothetical protein